MHTASASLLVIQDQLNHIKADMAVIVKAVEKEPSYAQQLQASASISNRKKQPVQKIQHALAMLVFERTNSILLQQSLLSRLNQHYDIVMQKQGGTHTTRQLCFLLGISLSLVQENYFSGTTRGKETTSYFKAGLLELSISQEE
jgi:hypothetical protein